MKKISLIIVLVVSLLMGCERKLPYDLKGITKGVAISFTKTPFTTLRLTPQSTDGTYSLNLTIPRLQGDYSFMSEARIMCLYTPGNGSAAQYVEIGVSVPRSDFEPETAVTVVINMPALCTLLGITAPQLNDDISFTADVILNNGSVIPGWTQHTGFTNSTFTRWQMRDGSSFQYRANYSALPDFAPDVFVSDNIQVTIDGNSSTGSMAESGTSPDPDIIPYGFTADDFYGYVFNMNYEGSYLDAAVNNMVLWVNEKDFSLLIPYQWVDDVNWGGDYVGALYFNNTTGSVNTSNITMTFTPTLNLIANNGTTYNFGTIVFLLTYQQP